jgi:hypothetical protein
LRLSLAKNGIVWPFHRPVLLVAGGPSLTMHYEKQAREIPGVILTGVQ